MKIFTPAVRHFLAWLLLGLAWNRLTRWHAYLHPADYLIFAACFVAAAAIASIGYLRFVTENVPPLRRALAAGILLLALPWGEWLRLALPDAREDWSRQLFLQACLLYAGLLALHYLGPVRVYIKDRTLKLLDHCSANRIYPLILSVVFFCFTAWIAFAVFQKILVIQDSAAHMFQAKIFRAGRLFAPAPPVPEAFSQIGDMLVLHGGKWYSSYLPGFSLLLAACMLVHLEWWLCPALGACTMAIWMAYARRWHDRWTSLLLGILCLFSPILFLMYSSVMVHAAELFIASATLYLCRRESEEPSHGRLSLLGVLIVVGVVTRGFSYLPFVAPALAYTAWKRLGGRFLRFAAVVSTTVLCGLILVGLYQWKTTGDPLMAAYDLEYGSPVPYGFHGEVVGQVHTPLRGLENVSNNFLGMNSWLTGWSTGILFFLLIFVLREKKFHAWDVVLFLCCVALAFFYYFIVFQDLVRGPRYWFPMVPILLLFLARGILTEDSRIRPYSVSIAVLAFAGYLGFHFPEYIKKYSPTPTQAGQLNAGMKAVGCEKRLIFLDRHAVQQFVDWNDPFLRSNLIVCSDLGSRNTQVIRAFPGYKPVYFRETQSLKKSTLTSGFKLMDSPNPDPPGYLSLFNFALVVQSAAAYADEDLFDLCYGQFMAGDTATDELAYLDRQEREEGNEPPLRKTLRAGLIHAARMMLLPKKAYEEKRKGWITSLDTAAFRHELESAIQQFQASGDVGQTLLEPMIKISRRIDRNDDGRLSDGEIRHFLSEKMRVLELG